MRWLLSALLLFVIGRARPLLVGDDVGTATFYGNPAYNGDPYGMHEGTCACWKARAYNVCYNDVCFDDIVYPYHVAAVSTPGIENTKECGTCYQVTCVPGDLRGTDHSVLGPWQACLYPNASVVVTVTDSCPCHHPNPNNAYHCCGPKKHFDLSFWAFEKIARHEFGVIDVEYKRVACPDTGVRMAKC